MRDLVAWGKEGNNVGGHAFDILNNNNYHRAQHTVRSEDALNFATAVSEVVRRGYFRAQRHKVFGRTLVPTAKYSRLRKIISVMGDLKNVQYYDFEPGLKDGVYLNRFSDKTGAPEQFGRPSKDLLELEKSGFLKRCNESVDGVSVFSFRPTEKGRVLNKLALAHNYGTSENVG